MEDERKRGTEAASRCAAAVPRGATLTYEDRVLHRELVERTTALHERLAAGEEDDPVTRAEAREIAALLEALLAQLAPERRDRMMETMADEAARRAASLAPAR